MTRDDLRESIVRSILANLAWKRTHEGRLLLEGLAMPDMESAAEKAADLVLADLGLAADARPGSEE